MERMANKEGMNLVKVNKYELLEKIKENLLAHNIEFGDAMDGFKSESIRELKNLLKDAKSGKVVPANIYFDIPECHEKDYETIIEMLEMSVDRTVFLTRSEFKQYIRDEWQWKETFMMSNAKYK